MIAICPHCQGHLSIQVAKITGETSRTMAELQAMVRNGGFMYGVLAKDGSWKNDPELARFLEKGWVELDEARGFRITEAGRAAAQG